MEPLKVLLADDSALFRKGIASLLAGCKDIQVVGEAADGREALARSRDTMPDVVLMDINMPGLNGIEATRLIKEEMPHIKVVMLTVSDDDQHLFEAIKAGAQGYLLKNLEPENLFEMLRGVSRGEAPLSQAIAARILGEFTRQHQETAAASAARTSARITDREREILQLVVTGATNKEIGRKLSISESTVKNHLRNIMEKLHVHNRVQAAMHALAQEQISMPPQA